jgi:hypothetical protein
MMYVFGPRTVMLIRLRCVTLPTSPVSSKVPWKFKGGTHGQSFYICCQPCILFIFLILPIHRIGMFFAVRMVSCIQLCFA